MLNGVEAFILRNDLPSEMFEAAIEPYLVRENEEELAETYRFILAIGLLRGDMRLVNITCDWLFNEARCGFLKPEAPTRIYEEVLAYVSEDEQMAKLFAEAGCEV